MSVEVRPLGVACNIACQYCYQNMHRDAGQSESAYDIGVMKEAILASGADSFHLFGGEPLLMPLDDLESMLSWGFAQYGVNGIQTNGVLLTEAHVALFLRYNVSVGLSIDGPGELNDARWAGTLDRTRAATAKSLDAIKLLCEHRIPPSLMIQLTRCNATPERLPQLCDWLVQVARLGVTRARVHILEIDHPLVRAKYSLSEADNVKAFREVFKAGRLCGIQFVESEEPEQLLMMNDEESTCIWRACDPFTTEAVYGIDGTGNRHNCGLTDKEGINFQRPSSQGFERYIALYHTPYEFGGCKGCRFFLACKGQCPGTGIDGDWRNRSENCGVWMALFDDAEKKLVERGETPISIHPQRHEIEMAMLAKWRAGMNPTLSALATELPQMSGCAARQQAE